MDGIARWLLLPFQTIWFALRSLSFADTPRPSDSPHVHAGRSAGERMLLVGDGMAIGWGVVTHDLGLGGAMARLLAPRLDCGVDIDLVVGVGLRAEAVLPRIQTMSLRRYDSIVVSVGVGDALMLTKQAAWQAHMRHTLDHLRAASTPRTRIFVLGVFPPSLIDGFEGGLGPVSDAHAIALDDILTGLCAERPHTTFIPLRGVAASIGNPLDSAGYRAWASFLTDAIAPVIAVADPINHELDMSPLELVEREEARQAAVEALREPGMDSDRALQILVDTAKRIFNTSEAAITIIDRDRQHYRAHTGVAHDDIARVDSICTVTISQAGALVVADADADERFKHLDIVRGPGLTRFYAGFPIESPEGERVGALCVLDDHPRSTADFDVSLLRELALIAQKELWPQGPVLAA